VETKVTTIVVADDFPVFRTGLKSLLEAEPNFRVIGEIGGGLEAVRLAERLRPNVVVVDLKISGINGLEVTRQISRRLPKTSVVILSTYSNQGHVLKALRTGAKAYILKDSPPEELILAIREVTAGRYYLAPALSEQAIEAYIHGVETNVLNEYDKLTTREREVLHLVAQGFTNTKIAAQLYISPRTVEIHRINMMHKLKLKTPTQLIRYAYKQGILRTDS
jgi:two-component system response regulator NreC